MDFFSMPIWKVEQVVFSGWYFLTGTERPVLRKVLFFSFFFMLFLQLFFLHSVLAKSLVLILGIIFFVIHQRKKPDGYKDSREINNRVISIYLDLSVILFYFANLRLLASVSFFPLCQLLFTFDYFILWADHMEKNNRSKRSESLPERLVKAFAAFKPIEGLA